jgi:mono/diheme cytochrome c family protein
MRAIIAIGALALALAACTDGQPDPQVHPREDFAANCAACHGTGGRGDGPAAATLARKPADLTQLSARNGGVFPGTRVMAKIWGYADGDTGSPMPGFAPMLDSALVPYDGGDGILTPTPVRLVALAEYLRLLQAP